MLVRPAGSTKKKTGGKKSKRPPSQPVTSTPPKDSGGSPTCADPASQFGVNCTCFEENTAYFGNNHVVGAENPQSSRLACQRSCAEKAECVFWTWGRGSPTGPCYLKTKRAQVTHGLRDYVSGSKDCVLPEVDKGASERASERATVKDSVALLGRSG